MGILAIGILGMLAYLWEWVLYWYFEHYFGGIVCWWLIGEFICLLFLFFINYSLLLWKFYKEIELSNILLNFLLSISRINEISNQIIKIKLQTNIILLYLFIAGNKNDDKIL